MPATVSRWLALPAREWPMLLGMMMTLPLIGLSLRVSGFKMIQEISDPVHPLSCGHILGTENPISALNCRGLRVLHRFGVDDQFIRINPGVVLQQPVQMDNRPHVLDRTHLDRGHDPALRERPWPEAHSVE